jgi:hypothetical protein
MSFKFKTVFKICVCIIIFISSCSKKFTANKPKEYYYAVDTIVEQSNINIVANFPLKEMKKKLNSLLPSVLYNDSTYDNDNYKIKVTRLGDLHLQPRGNLFNIKIPLKIYAKARLGSGFLSAEPEATFALSAMFSTKISATADWKIITQTTANGIEWINEPKLKLGPLEVNLAPFLEKELIKQQADVAKKIDKQVAESVIFKNFASEAWSFIQVPQLVEEDPKTFVTFLPKEVNFITPTGDTSKIKFGLGIKGIAKTFIGRKPEIVKTDLLPLKTQNVLDNNFAINLAVELPFTEASQIAMQQLRNQPIEFSNGKKKILIEDIEIYGSGEKIIVKSLLSGDFNGMVYLKGIPQFENKTNMISVRDLDFDIDSKNKLIKTADWMAHGILVKKIEKQFKFSIQKQIEDAKSMLNKNMAGTKINQNITLNGAVSTLTLNKIQIIRDNFLIFLGAKGNLELLVAGF